jgi:UDP-N-acetylmuramoyl-tripeptide--D-alanyl-D-alanine ligase
MSQRIWTLNDLAVAVGDAPPAKSADVTGFSIDTRTIKSGEVFVALKDQRDGHDFVTTAFKNGAVAALVSKAYQATADDGPLIRCDDVLTGLEAIGRAARARLSGAARAIAVTGSVGKTGTKEMLRACLLRIAPGRVHAADKSFNNHWGVPLTLASMPADTLYGVFEIGMNHSGEITPLAKMVRPHVAIITTVEAVHLEHFKSVDEIAEAKSEIFAGLEPGGTAILNRDNPHFELLAKRAAEAGRAVVSFGLSEGSDVRPERFDCGSDGTDTTVTINGQVLSYRVAAPGVHIAQNALAVAAAIVAIGADTAEAIKALSSLPAPTGRGARVTLEAGGGRVLLIDESYNANPASMRSALAAMATVSRKDCPRRIAVLGDMLELGPDAPSLHAGLVAAIEAAGVDLVFLAGPNMSHLHSRLIAPIMGGWAEASTGLKDALLASVQPGDVIMIKGSNGSRMALLVDALKEKFAPSARCL